MKKVHLFGGQKEILSSKMLSLPPPTDQDMITKNYPGQVIGDLDVYEKRRLWHWERFGPKKLPKAYK